MEHKDCVHETLEHLHRLDTDNPSDVQEEAQIDQLCELFLGLMREQSHGLVTKEMLEGAVIGSRMLFLRVLGLVAMGEIDQHFAHLLQHLLGEQGIVLSRAYYSESSSVADLEALWNL